MAAIYPSPHCSDATEQCTAGVCPIQETMELGRMCDIVTKSIF